MEAVLRAVGVRMVRTPPASPNGPGTRGYDIMLRTSADGGQSRSAPVTPHEDRTETFHGFVSLVPWPSGGFGIVWTDGGVVKPSDGSSPEVMKRDGSLRARVYRAPRRASPQDP